MKSQDIPFLPSPITPARRSKWRAFLLQVSAWRRHAQGPLVIGSILTTSAAGPPAHAMEANRIPHQLRNEPDDNDSTGPCSLCAVKSLKVAEEIAGSDAKLELYFDDENAISSGSLELLVLLHDGDYELIVIDDVTLTPGSTFVFQIPPGHDWDWGTDVAYVWVEPLPASSSVPCD